MPLKIAIIGAGPAGCTLARLLQVSPQHPNINVTIFEGESSINFRSQGGTLDLHTSTGQAALRAAGLFDEFLEYARYDGEAVKLADKKLLVYVSQGPSRPGKTSGGRPEIDRPRLREVLFESLLPGTVEWDRRLRHVDEAAEGLTLHFANGVTESGFDLLVGADGAWSRVRPLVTDVRPFYSGVAGHSFGIPDAAATHPELSALVNRGSLFAWSDGKSIMAQQMGDGSLNIGTWAVRPENWKAEAGYDVHEPQAVKEACKREFADWDERLVRFTQVAEDSSVSPRDLYMLPIGHRWKHKRGVTMIGDAAHLMTPFAGEGVNLALSDALTLSKAIISSAATHSSTSPSPQSTLDSNIRTFEQTMHTQSHATQQQTYDMMRAMYFTPGAPRTNIERYLLRAAEGEVGWWVVKLLVAPVVYVYFYVFRLIW